MKTKKNPNEELITELLKTQSELATVYSVFENVIDPDLIDCCIYQLNAIQMRYRFLLNQIRDENRNLAVTHKEIIIPPTPVELVAISSDTQLSATTSLDDELSCNELV